MRLNRRTAPQLYLEVQPVTGTIDSPRPLAGPGPGHRLGVRMRAFDQDGLWDRLAARGALGTEQVDAASRPLCELHRDAAVAAADSRYGRPEHVRAPLSDNLRVLGTLCTATATSANGSTGCANRRRRPSAACSRSSRSATPRPGARGPRRPAPGQRRADRRPPGVFDCLEVHADLRWTDVVRRRSSGAMDLRSPPSAALAHHFVDAYVEHSGDADGLRVLRYYQVHTRTGTRQGRHDALGAAGRRRPRSAEAPRPSSRCLAGPACTSGRRARRC